MPEHEVRGWLLQVLTEKPQNDWDKGLDKMSFGGGGAGFTKEGWEVVNSLFGFEYMGAAEYEFGAPNKALHALVTGDLEKAEVIIKAKDIKRDEWGRDRRAKKIEIPPYPGDTTVYVICQKGQLDGVKTVLKNIANGTQRSKEYPRGYSVFDPIEKIPRRFIGWLNLQPQEAFLAVIDKPTYEHACKLFHLDK